MSCSYTYKGKFIGDIQALNDFLLEKEPYLNKYGDQVFQIKNLMREAQDTIDRMLRFSETLQYSASVSPNQAYKNGLRNSENVDEEIIPKMLRPYIGVTEFLRGQRNSKGHLYFPEFIEKEYWSRRFIDWADGKFTDDEIKLFFDGDSSKAAAILLGNKNDWYNSNGELKEIFGTDEQKRMRKEMTDKWKSQAEHGTAIHNVLQKYFSTIQSEANKGKLWADFIEESDRNRLLFLNNIKEPLLDGPKIKEILDYAKSLKDELTDRFGKDIKFYPELTVSTKLNAPYEGRDDLGILGRIDLLVLDKDGIPHIIDYKASPKLFDKYAGAKKLGIAYQLAVYDRILRKWGFDTTKSNLMVAPIQMENFKKVNGKYTFDHVKKGNSQESNLLSYNDAMQNDKLNSNLDEFLELPSVLSVSHENVVGKVTEQSQIWFPDYGNGTKRDDNIIRSIITSQLGENWIDKQSGQYIFKMPGTNTEEIIVDNTGPDSELRFFNEVKKRYQNITEAKLRFTADLIGKIKEAQKTGNTDIAVKGAWVRAQLSKYCDPNWEIVEETEDVLRQFGMIMFRRKDSQYYDIVKISYNNLNDLQEWENGKGNLNIIGAHENDNRENSNSLSRILKGYLGNIEAIEALLVLNNIEFNLDIYINKIHVINPIAKNREGRGLTATNKEYQYTWNKLWQLKPLNVPNQIGKKIKLISPVEQVYLEFMEIKARLQEVTGGNFKNNFPKFLTALTDLHGVLEPSSFNLDIALTSLYELAAILENEFGMNRDVYGKGKNVYTLAEDYNNSYAKTLYYDVMQAILDLNNMIVRQEVKPAEKWLEHVNIFKHGILSTILDNPGNYSNQLLNDISKLVIAGVQSAREFAFPTLRELFNKTDELKRDLGFSGIKERTIGNLTSLFKDMTYFDSDNNLLFRNPWDDTDNIIRAMHPTLREYLKWALVKFNKNKHPEYTEEQLANHREAIPDFFEVPLVEASFASKIDSTGWWQWLKNRKKNLSVESMKDAASNFLSDEMEKEFAENNREIFNAINMIDQTSGPLRIDYINKLITRHGKEYFERDIERLLGTHTWAFATLKAFLDRMPLVKGAYMTLSMFANQQNEDYQYPLEFVEDFVKNRMNHLSIQDPRLKTVSGVTKNIQMVGSWMALAFSPMQFTYQSIEGIWKDCKLIITKPDGTEAFTADNMKAAAKDVYSELFVSSHKHTVISSLNGFYGINDMDAASFAENNSSNNRGMFNFFNKFAMKFSSRPDFYNRMTIFVSQMIADGCYKAHSVNLQTGQLEYDWKLDERYAAYANNDHSNEEAYLKAKGLYYAAALQLVKEGAKNLKGEDFKIGDALPKAYTNLEAESKKAIGDNMYGYYDSSKKSMMNATYLGGLLMQMKNYWSSKKNQYFAPGGIKNQGKWVQGTDPDGNLLYYGLGENGDIDYNAPLKRKDEEGCSNIPFMQWKGKFEEGIFVTLADIISNANWSVNIFKSFKEAYLAKINDPDLDEDVRKTYISNMKQFIFDVVICAILGSLSVLAIDWSDELIKEAKNEHNLSMSASATLFNILTLSLYRSKNDFFMMNEIFSPTLDWNPFVISYLGGQAKNLGLFITGDKDFGDVILRSTSAIRQMRPMFDYVEAA